MADSFVKYEPTENQRTVLSAWQRAKYVGTVEKLCEKGGVDARTWYYWFDSPEFVEWWRAEAEKYFARQLPRVQGALFVAATTARRSSDAKMDTAAIKLFFERFDRDFIPKTRRKQHITADFKCSDMTEAELARAIQATSIDELFEANPTGSPD